MLRMTEIAKFRRTQWGGGPLIDAMIPYRMGMDPEEAARAMLYIDKAAYRRLADAASAETDEVKARRREERMQEFISLTRTDGTPVVVVSEIVGCDTVADAATLRMNNGAKIRVMESAATILTRILDKGKEKSDVQKAAEKGFYGESKPE